MKMNGLTAADFADTGQWRLILGIRRDGMCAHLENTLHEGIDPQELFSVSWMPDDSSMLRNIENAVYDHPRVLDDFSAKIIIYDKRVAFMPSSVAEEYEGAEENIFTALYDGNPDDVMTESDKDVTAAYATAPGLKGFLSRTFPGARVGCNLMDFLGRVRKGEGKRLHVAVRDLEADFILLDDEKLMSASTHDWHDGNDIIYHAFNLLDVYGVTPSETMVFVCGVNVPGKVPEAFRRYAGSVTVNP